MPFHAVLQIGLTPISVLPYQSGTTLNLVRGGPASLLAWLETQLGLPVTEHPWANRVLEYYQALKLSPNTTSSSYASSFSLDPWATASELARRHEELELAGWDPANDDPANSEGLPKVVCEMAQACKNHVFLFPSIADRIRRILDSLDNGQKLPKHECQLLDPLEMWPKLWQQLLRRLTHSPFLERPSERLTGTLLNQILGKSNRGGPFLNLDSSLRWTRSLSQTLAVEYVAAYFEEHLDKLPRMVLLCSDDHVATQVDAALLRRRVPTMGARPRSQSHPVLQVLPLALSLCQRPLDPQNLLDFLSLPVCPLPARVAGKLARALTQEPGLGSESWEKALSEICDPENDPEGKIKERIELWLYPKSASVNESLSTSQIRERAGAVAKWATGLAAVQSNDADAQAELIEALRAVAAQAALLGQLAESLDSHLSWPQLSRLMDEVRAAGIEATGATRAENGPSRVRSLAEITEPCYQIIWLGLGAPAHPGSCWSAEQRSTFRSFGIELDDGTLALQSLRQAELRGLQLVENAVFAIGLPADSETPLHPIWLAIQSRLGDSLRNNIPILDRCVEQGDLSPLGPFACPLTHIPAGPSAHVAPEVIRDTWAIDPGLLSDVGSSSATELETRLACPLKWVFEYRAFLKPSSIAQLPSDFQLKGNFCHKVLELAFGSGGPLPSVEQAVAKVENLFDERLESDAAPLAQADKYRERVKLRKQLSDSTRALIHTLAAGGYRIQGIEIDFQSRAMDSPISGSIDCLAKSKDGREAIIDFKYGGRKDKYPNLLKDGRATQLATYAHVRSQDRGVYPDVAYLVLSDGALFTPSGSEIQGDTHRRVVDGPSIQRVWDRFNQALQNAQGWLETGQIPVRPLQSVDEWPDGATIVLDEKLKKTESQQVCKYCNYQKLCGIGGIQ